jgi:hypothetical protein
MMKTRGLLCNVYRSSYNYDCTNNGISSTQNTLILDGTDGPFEGNEENSVKLVKKQFSHGEYVHVEPLFSPVGKIGPMFGGNFLWTSDSRFPMKYPIPIHDRYE